MPQGQIWTVERFGRFTRVLHPGLNFMTPFVERVGRKMNVQEIVIDIPEQAVITRDNAAVVVDGNPVLPRARRGTRGLWRAETSCRR